MSARRIIVAAASLLALSAAASAHTHVVVQVAQPAYYVAPAPVVAYVPVRASRMWVPGRWEWQGNGHVWVPGHYELVQRGYAMRDTDGDGVPDRFDRAPFNPERY